MIDPACSLVFEAERGQPSLMRQPPRRTTEPLLPQRWIWLSVCQGMLVMLVVATFYLVLLAWHTPVASARAMTFVLLVSANALLLVPSRTPTADWSALRRGWSPAGGWVLGITFLALGLVTGLPALASSFGFAPLSLAQWGVASLVALPLLALQVLLWRLWWRVGCKPGAC